MGCGASKIVGCDGIQWDGSVEPAPEEQELYAQCAEVLARREESMQLILEYKGCQELARAALSTPSEETELAAFEGLMLAVASISNFFKLARDIGAIFPQMLQKLAQCPRADGVLALDAMPGLTRQLVDMLDFALEFDRIRMLRPNLSNDFSYYRRLLPKFNKHPDNVVKDDEAAGMALFTAEHIPMISTLSSNGATAQRENDGCSMVLSTLANSCLLTLKHRRPEDDKLATYLARAMAGFIVLFDHVDDVGAFTPRGPVSVKQTVLLLKRDFPKETALVNAIHFSSKHFRDAPDNIQAVFD